MLGLLSTPGVRWLIGPTFQDIGLIWQSWSLCLEGQDLLASQAEL